MQYKFSQQTRSSLALCSHSNVDKGEETPVGKFTGLRGLEKAAYHISCVRMCLFNHCLLIVFSITFKCVFQHILYYDHEYIPEVETSTWSRFNNGEKPSLCSSGFNAPPWEKLWRRWNRFSRRSDVLWKPRGLVNGISRFCVTLPAVIFNQARFVCRKLICTRCVWVCLNSNVSLSLWAQASADMTDR